MSRRPVPAGGAGHTGSALVQYDGASTEDGRSGHGISGGQIEFSRGAARTPRGRPIIALPSTALGGQASRVVTQLARGVCHGCTGTAFYAVAP